MTANVRRLVFDVTPMWAIVILALYGVIGMMDWVALTRPSVLPLFLGPAALAFGVPGLLAEAKAGMRHILPLTPRERVRAVWWLSQGGPMLLLAGMMAVLAVVAAGAGQLRSPPSHILACLGGQFAAGSALIATGLVSTAMRWRFGMGATQWFGAPAVCAILLAAVIGVPAALFDAVLLPAGALALTGAIATWLAGEKIMVALKFAARLGLRPGAVIPQVQDRRRTGGEARRGVGWLTLLRPLGIVFVATVALTAAAPLFLSRAPHMGDLHGFHVAAIAAAAIAGALPAGAVKFVARVLRALPLGSAALTAVLQGSMTIFVLALFLALQLLFAAAGQYDAELWLAALAALPLIAVSLPIRLRLGPVMGAFAGVMPIIALPVLSFDRVAPATAMIAVDLALLGLVWGWTWWELARGRAAYRTWYAGAMSWRGVAG